MNMHLHKPSGGSICKDTNSKLGTPLSFQNTVVWLPPLFLLLDTWGFLLLKFPCFPLYLGMNTGIL